MEKKIGKINGCALVLKHRHKHKDVSKASIKQAEKWLSRWTKGTTYEMVNCTKKD